MRTFSEFMDMGQFSMVITDKNGGHQVMPLHGVKSLEQGVDVVTKTLRSWQQEQFDRASAVEVVNQNSQERQQVWPQETAVRAGEPNRVNMV
jgi:hypothetical protein